MEEVDRRPVQAPPLVITGATGFVGAHLLACAREWPGDVTCVSRRPIGEPHGYRVVQGELKEPTQLVAQMPRGAVVVNLAYDPKGGRDANAQLVDGLAELCRGIAAKRLVHISTATVVGVVSDRWVTEDTPSRPATAYQRDKLEIERRLQAQMRGICPVIVLRPTAVFGTGGLNLVKLAEDLAHQAVYRNYLRASLFGRRPMNLVPVETVAAAALFTATVETDEPYAVFLVADDEDPDNNYRYVEDAIRLGLGFPTRRVPPLPLPSLMLRAMLRLARRLSFDPRTRFSSARLIDAGFVRPVTFKEALSRYASRLRRPLRASGAVDP